MTNLPTYAVSLTRNGAAVQHNGADPTAWLVPPLIWRTGRRFGAQRLPTAISGQAEVRLLNDSGEWAGIQSGDELTITMTVSGQAETMWRGLVDRQADRVGEGGRRTLSIRARGYLGHMADVPITIAEQQSVRSDVAAQSVCTAAGVPASRQGTFPASDTLAVFAADDETGLDVLRKIEATVVGVLYEDRQGRPAIQGFLARAKAVAAGALTGYHDFEYADDSEREYVAFEGATTQGVIVRKASVPVTNDLDYARYPDNFISTVPRLEFALTSLIGLGPQGQQAHTVHWHAANNYALAQGFEIGQVLTLASARLTGEVVIEGMRHRVWRGGRHDVRLTVSDAAPYRGIFVADVSTCDGPDRML